MSATSEYGMTPEQLHAGLDKLWKALGFTGVQKSDVFTLAADVITQLKGDNRALRGGLPVAKASPSPAGLYRKFEVRRTDGRDAPGEKHHGCYYFVLDVMHDKYAAAGLRAYADDCQADMPDLATDARALAEVNDHESGRKVHDGYFPPVCYRAIGKIESS